MSLARDWISAALKADLTQNELRAFLVVFQQTLCYGKTADELTIKRISQLSGIRADRVTPAVGGIIGKGLVDALPSKKFDHRFSIPDDFLAVYAESGFFVPALPKNGEGFCFSGGVSEKRVHTSNTFTSSNLTPTPTPAADSTPLAVAADAGGGVDKSTGDEQAVGVGLPYPDGFGAQGRKRAAVMLDGLAFEDARDCLRLLALAMAAGKVKSPLGYLHQLAAAARAGALDRGALGGCGSPALAAAPVPGGEAAGRRAANVDGDLAQARWLVQTAGLAGLAVADYAAMVGLARLLPLVQEVQS